MKSSCIASMSFLLASYILTLMLFGFIIDKRKKSKKEIVYYLSKISSVKNIVKTNHRSKIFNNFNEEGNLEGINIYYQRLLQLIEKGKCKTGYKRCGILDTIGNILCIDETFDCPINQINVDLKSERNKYLNKGFNEVYNENLIYNYQFYYSNNAIDNNIIVSILFSQNQPHYITISNFGIDTEAYEDIIGPLPAVNEENSKKENVDEAIQDVIIGIVAESQPIVGNVIKVVFSLLSYVSDKYMPSEDMDDFKKYVEEKIQLEENKVDKYFINIGENAYIKNYIGFESLDDIETFMNFDYKKIYKKIFPSQNVYIASITFEVIDFLLFFIDMVLFIIFEIEIEKNEKNYFNNKIIKNVVNNQNNENNKHKQVNNPSVNNNEMKENNENKEASINSYNNINNNNISEEKRNMNNIKDNNSIEKMDKTKNSKKRYKYFLPRVIVQIATSVIFILSNLWILLSAVKRYWNINDNFIDLKKVKSDDFVESFIKEFIEICCKKGSLYYASIVVSSIAVPFHLVGVILLFILLFK